jgi:hypothetical protein
MLPAVVGVVGGLYSFFHGFSILQQQRPLPVSLPAKSTAHACKPVTVVAQDTATAKREARTEIIQLSSEQGTTSAALMTQQGKIAAAMLRAGIPNPATSTNDSDGNSVRVADRPSAPASMPPIETKVSVVMDRATAGSPLPGLESTFEQQSAKRKAMLLIWGGPALTLTCVYFLAAHLGWL